MALFCLLLAVGAAYALRVFLVWDAHVLLLTNKRLVHVEQLGVWRRHVKELPIASIEQVSVERRGPGDAMFGTGVLRIRAHGNGSIAFAGVARPELLVSQIEKARPSSAPIVGGFQLKPM